VTDKTTQEREAEQAAAIAAVNQRAKEEAARNGGLNPKPTEESK
jgi:hypothetical protein